MKGVVYWDTGSVKVVDDVPEPRIQDPQDALVSVSAATICGSDLHILHSSLLGVQRGNVIGHEFSGVVEEVGPAVENIKPGDRVVAAAGVCCGKCPFCRSNMILACPHLGIYGHGSLLGDLQGGQAERVRVPFADMTLEKIPEGLTDEQVLFVGDILSTAYMGVAGALPGRPALQPGSTVAVFGAGPVGLCAVAAAGLFGPARIIAVDREEYRLEMALKLGADTVVNAAEGDPAAAIFELTGGRGADLVIEAVGSPEAFAGCLASAAFYGNISVLGAFQQQPVEMPMTLLFRKNLNISVGLVNLIYMRKLIDLIEAEKLDVTPIITHRMPLEEAVKAYHIFENKLDGAIKVILKP